MDNVLAILHHKVFFLVCILWGVNIFVICFHFISHKDYEKVLSSPVFTSWCKELDNHPQ
jgi:hypothetical protein